MSVTVAETLLKVPPELMLLEFNTSPPTLQVMESKLQKSEKTDK